MKKRIIISLIFLMILLFLVLSNNISWFDSFIYNLVLSFKSAVTTNFFKFITFFASVKLMIILTALSLLGLIWKRKESLYLIATVVISSLLNVILKNIFKRDRPLNYRFIEETGFSFPSGHAMGSMAFYGSIIVLVMNSNIPKKYKNAIVFLLSLLIFLIGISRIYLGVHYPSDILCGWLIGFILLNILDKYVKEKL